MISDRQWSVIIVQRWHVRTGLHCPIQSGSEKFCFFLVPTDDWGRLKTGKCAKQELSSFTQRKFAFWTIFCWGIRFLYKLGVLSLIVIQITSMSSILVHLSPLFALATYQGWQTIQTRTSGVQRSSVLAGVVLQRIKAEFQTQLHQIGGIYLTLVHQNG